MFDDMSYSHRYSVCAWGFDMETTDSGKQNDAVAEKVILLKNHNPKSVVVCLFVKYDNLSHSTSFTLRPVFVCFVAVRI